MAAVVLPGERFNISVHGQEYSVKALSGAEQLELAKLIDEAQRAEISGESVEAMVLAAKACLDVAVGEGVAKELWETKVNTRIAVEIASRVFIGSELSEDEAKN